MSESTNTTTTTAPAPVATIASLSQHEGRTVTLRGWLYNKRVKGKIAFLMIRDGSGVAQCVAVKNEIGDAKFAVCDHVPQESSLELVGTVRADELPALAVKSAVQNAIVMFEVSRPLRFSTALQI